MKVNPMRELINSWQYIRISEIKKLKRSGTPKQELIDRFGYKMVNVALSMKG